MDALVLIAVAAVLVVAYLKRDQITAWIKSKKDGLDG